MTSLLRCAALTALVFGTLGLFVAMPSEALGWLPWTAVMVTTKGGCAACIVAVTRLYGRWSRTDAWVGAYDRWAASGLADDEE